MTTTLRFGDLTIEGASAAGYSTWFRVRPPGLGFDVGTGAMELVGTDQLFISHGHLDHALGVPFLISQRSVQQPGAAATVYCPESAAGALDEFIRAAERLETGRYLYSVVPLAPGARVKVGKGYWVEAFAADHVIPSLGYHLIREKTRLRADLEGLPGSQIAELRHRGETVDELVEERRLSYCGDTGPGLLDRAPELFEVPILMMECTFLGREMAERSAKYGHLHLDDLVARAGRFRNQALILYHLSRRHRRAELEIAIRERLPELAPRIFIIADQDQDRL